MRRRGLQRSAAVLLLAALIAALACGAAAISQEEDRLAPYLGAVPVANGDEAEMAQMMIEGFMSISKEVLTGEEDTTMKVRPFSFNNATAVNASDVQAKVFATALATWQMGVWDAPSNRGLRASKFLFYDRYHYYQIPKDPIGTLVMFHGCYHDASGNWPYHPDICPECLGLPEEVAHVKLALKYGFAVLAVESRNRSQHGRCFSSSADPETSDMWQAPYIIQNFLYEKGLQNLPVYTLGISAGAAFATKLPKAFYEVNFGGIIKLGGIISEVNAPASWKSWGLVHRNGTLKYPDFPPVAFIMMERDDGPGSTNDLIRQRIVDLRNHSIPADYLMVRPRRIGKWFFHDRAPTITAKQSHAIVAAMQKLGFLDKDGWLKDDPRIGNVKKGSPLFQWNKRLVEKLPWLHMSIPLLDENPMLSVLSDRSAIFEEMNVAYAMHEGIADHLVPCLFWLRSRGKLDLQWLSSKFSVQKLRDITMKRVYPAPLPPMPPPVSSPPPPAPKEDGTDGKKTSPAPPKAPAGKKGPPAPAGKKAPPTPAGKKAPPTPVGKNAPPRPAGKKAPPTPAGKKPSPPPKKGAAPPKKGAAPPKKGAAPPKKGSPPAKKG